MRNRIAFLSVVTVSSLLLAAADAAAAPVDEPSALSSAASAGPGPWLVRTEGSLVGMRDNWLGLPAPELGLTVGRDLAPRFSVELTGSMRDPTSTHRSWSALAAARVAVLASATGHHALTVAAGPFFEIDNYVHGTLPFAHAEVAYVYRAPFGLTVLAGGGPNIALASSPYTPPPPTPCGNGDSPTFCIDLGPDAQPIHAGDANLHLRLAVGWQF